MTTLTESAQWQTLESLAQLVKKEHMRNWFASDENRAAEMNAEACGIYIDFSKNRVTKDVLKALFDLADERGVAQHRDEQVEQKDRRYEDIIPYSEEEEHALHRLPSSQTLPVRAVPILLDRLTEQ